MCQPQSTLAKTTLNHSHRLSTLPIALIFIIGVTVTILWQLSGECELFAAPTAVNRTVGADSARILASFGDRYEIEILRLGPFRTPDILRGRKGGGFDESSPIGLVHEFLEDNYAAFNIRKARESTVDAGGGGINPLGTCVKIAQRLKGLPVRGTGASFCLDSNGETFSFSGELLPDTDLSVLPSIADADAEQVALVFARQSRPTASLDSNTVLAICVEGSTPRLAWRVKVRFEAAQHWGMVYYVDANSGEMLAADEVNIWTLNQIAGPPPEVQNTPHHDSLATGERPPMRPPQTPSRYVQPSHSDKIEKRSPDSTSRNRNEQEGDSGRIQETWKKTRPGSNELNPDLHKGTTGSHADRATAQGTHESMTHAPGWELRMEEKFEGLDFPTGWELWSDPPLSPGWHSVSCEAASGQRSAWCAGSTTTPLGPCGDYADSMQAGMAYDSPFDLSDCTDFLIQFRYKHEIASPPDRLLVGFSFDGVQYVGNTLSPLASWGWEESSNLNYIGDPSVWTSFYFESDGEYTAAGSFIDEVSFWTYHMPDLQCHSYYPAGPIIISASPGQFTQAPQITIGEDYYITFSWANTGTAYASSHDVKLYLDGVEVLWSSAPILLESGTLVVQDQILQFVYPGPHVLKLEIDQGGEVEELDEANNSCEFSFEVDCAYGPAIGQGCSVIPGLYKYGLNTSCRTDGLLELRDRISLQNGHSIWCREQLAGNPALTDEDNIWNDPNQCEAVDALYYTTTVQSYFWQYWSRGGYDDNWGDMNVVVRWASGSCGNSGIYLGAQYLVGGTCAICPILSPPLDRSIAGSLDVVAHEWAHGVTIDEGGPQIGGEPATLSESFSDIVGAVVSLSNPFWDENPWRLGENAYISNTAFRDIADPTALGHPDTYLGTFWNDIEGCVQDPMNEYCWKHKNCGVPNKAFALAALGGEHNKVPVTGIGPHEAAFVWYKSNRSKWESSTRFYHAAVKTIEQAKEMDPTGQYEATVQRAWAAVGVICECAGDPRCDGVVDVSDVIDVVGRAFRGDQGQIDGPCPFDRYDVNCDDLVDVLDVITIVNVAFRGIAAHDLLCGRGVNL